MPHATPLEWTVSLPGYASASFVDTSVRASVLEVRLAPEGGPAEPDASSVEVLAEAEHRHETGIGRVLFNIVTFLTFPVSIPIFAAIG